MFRFYYCYLSADRETAERILYFSSHTRFDSIAFGCLFALIYPTINFTRVNNLWFLIISVTIIIFSLTYRDWLFRQTYRYSIQGIGLMIFFIFLFNVKHGLLLTVLESKILVFIGKLSYSIYLFHWLAIQFANFYFIPFTVYWYLIFGIITIAFSFFSYYFIENPFVKYRKKFGSIIA